MNHCTNAYTYNHVSGLLFERFVKKIRNKENSSVCYKHTQGTHDYEKTSTSMHMEIQRNKKQIPSFCIDQKKYLNKKIMVIQLDSYTTTQVSNSFKSSSDKAVVLIVMFIQKYLQNKCHQHLHIYIVDVNMNIA